jgi:hypothetical protein
LPIIGRCENPSNRCYRKQRDPAECGKKIKGGATYILDKAMHMSENRPGQLKKRPLLLCRYLPFLAIGNWFAF